MPPEVVNLLPQLGTSAAVVVTVGLFLKFLAEERRHRTEESTRYLEALETHSSAISALTLQCQRAQTERRAP